MKQFLDILNNKHNEAIKSIELHFKSDQEELVAILEHIITTSRKPNDFLPDGFGYSTANAQEFSGFCDILRHALCDNGDVSFPIINGEPKIFFISQHENNFLEHIPKPPSFLPFNKEINLDGFCKDGFDFIKKSNEYQSNYIKGCFLEYALNDNHNSLNSIVEKYKSNFPNDFQDEWIDEINP